MHAVELEVERVGGRSVVAEDREETFGAKNLEGKFAEDRMGGLTEQDGVCTLRKTHPAVAYQNDRMLHGARWDNARPNSEFGWSGVAMQKLDSEPDGGRGEEGGRFTDS